MSTISANLNSRIIGQMRDSGIAIDVAVKFHSFMRNSTSSQNTRKVVRAVLQKIRKNINATK